MNKFAKLYTLETTQVLITKDFSNENGYLITARIEIDGNIAALYHSYEDKEDRDNAFNEIELKDAVMLKNMIIERIAKDN